MASVGVKARGTKASWTNCASASCWRSYWIAIWIVIARSDIDNRAVVAGNGIGASNVWGCSRNPRVYLGIRWIGADEAVCPVQKDVINWDACIVLWGAIVVNLAENAGRRINWA